jgi:hypothetical protein
MTAFSRGCRRDPGDLACTRQARKSSWRYALEVLALVGGTAYFLFGTAIPLVWHCLAMPLGRATGFFAPLPAEGAAPQPLQSNAAAPFATPGIQLMGKASGYERMEAL